MQVMAIGTTENTEAHRSIEDEFQRFFLHFQHFFCAISLLP